MHSLVLQAFLPSLLCAGRPCTGELYPLTCKSRQASLFVCADISKMLSGKTNACNAENKEKELLVTFFSTFFSVGFRAMGDKRRGQEAIL